MIRRGWFPQRADADGSSVTAGGLGRVIRAVPTVRLAVNTKSILKPSSYVPHCTLLDSTVNPSAGVRCWDWRFFLVGEKCYGILNFTELNVDPVLILALFVSSGVLTLWYLRVIDAKFITVGEQCGEVA